MTFLIGDKKGGRKELNNGIRNNNMTKTTRKLNLFIYSPQGNSRYTATAEAIIIPTTILGSCIIPANAIPTPTGSNKYLHIYIVPIMVLPSNHP